MTALDWSLCFAVIGAFIYGGAVGFLIAWRIMDGPVSMDVELDDMAEHGKRR